MFLGQALALITAACWACNSVAYRYLGQKMDSSFLAHVRMWMAVPIILSISLAANGGFPSGVSTRTIIFLLLSGFFGYFVTDMLMFKAYIYLGARESLVILNLAPVASAIMSWFLFAEKLSILQISAVLMTISGIIIMVLGEAKGAKDNKDKSKAKLGIALAIFGALFQAVSYILAKYALNDIDALSSNMMRNVGGLIAFIIYGLLFQRSFFKDMKVFKDKKLIYILLISVIIGPVGGMTCQMQAMNLAPVGIVTAISQVSPVLLLPVDKFILKKKLTLSSIAGTIISILGVALLFI